jgi:hypothetical protein
MTDEEMMTTAGLTWRYIDSATQADHTDNPDREDVADEATLYTEDGAVLVTMQLMTVNGYRISWFPMHSELLDATALRRVRTVHAPSALDIGELLDIETEAARL